MKEPQTIEEMLAPHYSPEALFQRKVFASPMGAIKASLPMLSLGSA